MFYAPLGATGLLSIDQQLCTRTYFRACVSSEEGTRASGVETRKRRTKSKSEKQKSIFSGKDHEVSKIAKIRGLKMRSRLLTEHFEQAHLVHLEP